MAGVGDEHAGPRRRDSVGDVEPAGALGTSEAGARRRRDERHRVPPGGSRARRAHEGVEEARLGGRSHGGGSSLVASPGQEEYEAGGYCRRVRVHGRSSPGSGSRPGPVGLPVGRLSGASAVGSSLRGSCSAAADLLLLDEPTNHLDTDAKAWLMRFLAAYRGALLVVSHDIALLDASITRILHLDRDGVVEYRGTYSQYREARAQDEERLPRSPPAGGRDPRAEDPGRLDAGADREARAQGQDARHAWRDQARKVRCAHRAAVRFRFPEPPHSGRTVLVVEG